MNAPLGRWTLMRSGMQVQETETAKHYLGLSKMATLLRIPNCEALVGQHHNAGADAHITCLIYASVLQAVRTELGTGGKDANMTCSQASTDSPDGCSDPMSA